MVKLLVTFALFVLLHLVGWGVSHIWLKKNPHETLLVFDTSFAMKPHFDEMWQWSNDYAERNRYTRIVVGTDKETIGDFDTVRSQGEILRSAFGKFDGTALDKYKTVRNDKKILLSDGNNKPDGWHVIVFN